MKSKWPKNFTPRVGLKFRLNTQAIVSNRVVFTLVLWAGEYLFYSDDRNIVYCIKETDFIDTFEPIT